MPLTIWGFMEMDELNRRIRDLESRLETLASLVDGLLLAQAARLKEEAETRERYYGTGLPVTKD